MKQFWKGMLQSKRWFKAFFFSIYFCTWKISLWELPQTNSSEEDKTVPKKRKGTKPYRPRSKRAAGVILLLPIAIFLWCLGWTLYFIGEAKDHAKKGNNKK